MNCSAIWSNQNQAGGGGGRWLQIQLFFSNDNFFLQQYPPTLPPTYITLSIGCKVKVRPSTVDTVCPANDLGKKFPLVPWLWGDSTQENICRSSRKIFCFSSWITTDLSQISVRRRRPALSCVKTGKCKMKTLHCPDKNKKIVELKQWHHETRSSIWSPAPSHPSGLHGCKKEISVEGKQMGKDIRLSPNWIVSRDTWQIVRTFQLVVVNILTVNLCRDQSYLFTLPANKARYGL